MAVRRLMECKNRRCINLTRNEFGYCDEHISEYETKEKQRRKKFIEIYNKKNKYNQFYGSIKWKKLRAYVLVRDNYLCQECLKKDNLTEATDVHHIEKIRLSWDKRYDADNCISVCHECHRKLDSN